MTKEDVTHLRWLFDRLVEVYGNPPNLDYMIRFGKIIQQAEKDLHEEMIQNVYNPPGFSDSIINEIKQEIVGQLGHLSTEERHLIMQEIQVLNETMDMFYECDQVESAELVGEKLMILVNKLVPTE